jgi:hypothetical protein
LRRIMLIFMMISLVATMVTVSAMSGTAQEGNDEDQYRSKAEPPGEEDSPPEQDLEPVCTDWLQDWYIWEDPRGVEDWWYFYWYQWCYDLAEEEWFIDWDGWEWWGPA